jgi:hypothetical protein
MQFFRFETLSMMFKLLNRVRLNMDLNELVVDAPVDSIAPNWCNVSPVRWICIRFKSRFVLGFSHEYIAVFNVHFLLIIKDHLKTSSHSGDTPLILFDYHVLCKGGKKDKLEMLKKKAQPYLNKFKVFVRKGDDIVRYFSRIIYLF